MIRNTISKKWEEKIDYFNFNQLDPDLDLWLSGADLRIRISTKTFCASGQLVLRLQQHGPPTVIIAFLCFSTVLSDSHHYMRIRIFLRIFLRNKVITEYHCTSGPPGHHFGLHASIFWASTSSRVDLNADPHAAFHSNSDPDPASKNNADLDPDL
jgi:hypothetical protein